MLEHKCLWLYKFKDSSLDKQGMGDKQNTKGKIVEGKGFD